MQSSMLDARQFKKPAPPKDLAGSKPTGEPAVSPNELISSLTNPAPEAKVADQPEDTTPAAIKEYLEFLKANDVEETDVYTVLDTIITTGTVEWQFDLFDKIPVTFRMRPQWVNEWILKQFEVENPQSYQRYQDLLGTYNLAGALRQYGKQAFLVPTEGKTQAQLLEESTAFIRDMAFAVRDKLIHKLAIFDRLIAVAMSDWALENFQQPR